VEKMELDAAAGELPSLAESFASQARRTVEDVFDESGGGERRG